MKEILLIATGGTIASTNQGSGLEPTLMVEKILEYLPELPEGCHVSGIQLMNLDSSNIGRPQWKQMILKIEKEYDQYDGFIILHGTDTLAYTSSVLSYMIQQSGKPIIVTGAQHSLVEEGSDGVRNLHDSICVAMDEKSHGVLVVFDGDVIVGTRGKKVCTKSNHSIESINMPRAATVEDGEVHWNIDLQKPESLPVFTHPKEPSIHLVKVTPYINSELIELVFHKYDYVVLEGFGSGNLPELLFDDLKTLSQRYETLIVVGTQVLKEGTDMSSYEAGRRFLSLERVVEAKDMTMEAVMAKIMWMQSIGVKELEEQKRIFQQVIWYDCM
ncbi:MAG: asparaginase [Anaerostipes sp.]|jgi:L-asparaginase